MMSRALKVKGKAFGTGAPIVCVPVCEKEADKITEKIRLLTERGAEMIEWRADYFTQADDAGAVTGILDAVRDYVADTVLLFTFRTAAQGGERAIDDDKLLYLCECAAASGCVDMVDVEYYERSKPERAIRRLKEKGAKVIASQHDFDGTPDTDIMKIVLDQMCKSGADIVKLAVMPHDPSDVIRLMQEGCKIRDSHPDIPLIAISMGKTGMISRVSGEFFGSCVSFGADGAGSAPGQMQEGELRAILRKLHESAFE